VGIAPRALNRPLTSNAAIAIVANIVEALSDVAHNFVPLAAVLWSSGISFAGVLALLFAD